MDSTGQHSFGPDRLPNTTIHTALTRLRRQLSQTPAPPDGLRMSKMRQDMMARMSARDDRITTLGIEMNAAKTTDEKSAAVTKRLNVFIEHRSMMRMQVDTQGKMMEQICRRIR